MAEELYFFKIDRKKIEHKLVPLLKAYGTFSFSNFINNPVQYTKIVDNIQDNITNLDMDDFFDIWQWFTKKANNRYPGLLEYSEELSRKVENDMSDCGLIYFNEIPSKTPVRKFHEIMGNYEYHTNKDIDFFCSVDEFESFLNYLICYTGELSIFLNKFYYKDEYCPENIEIENTINVINDKNDLFHSLALSELKNENEYNIETIKLTEKLKKFRQETSHMSIVTIPKELSEISERESDILNKAGILYYGIGLKEDLDNYNGLIIRLHSY